jgi:hypothetical protein
MTSKVKSTEAALRFPRGVHMVTFGTFLLVFVILWMLAAFVASIAEAEKAYFGLMIPLAVWLTIAFPALDLGSVGFNNLIFGAGHDRGSIDSVICALVSIVLGIVVIVKIADGRG